MTVRQLLLGILALAVPQTVWSQSCPNVVPVRRAWSGSALHHAIRADDVNAVGRLIRPGTINKRDNLGNKPLIAALTPARIFEPSAIVANRRARELVPEEIALRDTLHSAGANPAIVDCDGDSAG